jgi:DNA-binding NarL/FixJ family response regulator
MRPDIRIIIADDHPLLRKGLREVIEEEPSFHVVGEADDGDATLDQIEAVRPDVVVLDVDMPTRDGLAVLREIRARGLATAAIVLTLHADARLLIEAIDLGARGYILKDSALTTIVEAIKTVTGAANSSARRSCLR